MQRTAGLRVSATFYFKGHTATAAPRSVYPADYDPQGSIVEAVDKQLSGFENWVVRSLPCCQSLTSTHGCHGNVVLRDFQRRGSKGSARGPVLDSCSSALRQCTGLRVHQAHRC